MSLKPHQIEYLCQTRNVCRQCREDEQFRTNVGLPDVCPYGIVSSAIPPSSPRAYKITEPGDLLGIVIYKITGENPCKACDRRRKEMNKWGWLGCWRNREKIIGWILLESKKRGHDVGAGEVLSLMKAAMGEIRKERKKKKWN